MINKVLSSINEAKDSLNNQEEAMSLYKELMNQATILRNQLVDVWHMDHIEYMHLKMLNTYDQICEELKDFESFCDIIMKDGLYYKMHYSSLKKGFDGKLNIYNSKNKGKLTLKNMKIGYDKFSTFRDIPFNRYSDEDFK